MTVMDPIAAAAPAASPAATTSPPRRSASAPPLLRRLWARVADEPLAHFLAIGLVLFALDRIVSPQAEDPKLIRIDETVYGGLVDIFAEARGRAPTVEEMAVLADREFMNETLYREARALGLEEGDDMIRERIMQKMRVLIQSGVAIDPPDEATLRAWFEENRARYDAPPMLSLRLARIDGSEAEARGWAERLDAFRQRGAPLADGQGGPPPQVYPFISRSRDSLVSVFGEPFVAEVESLPGGRWTAIETPNGWQAALLEESLPAEQVSFDEARTAAAADWTDEMFRLAARRSVEALMAGYRVELDEYRPEEFEARALAAQQEADDRAATEK